jgi:type VI secretion system protein ImpK
MNAGARAESFLLTQFEEFYQEVIRLKQLVRYDCWTPSAERLSTLDRTRLGTATTVWQQLLSVLERQALTPRWSGNDFGAEFFREVQYAMAALADEIFLQLDWEGKEPWRSNLLESKLFHTHVAGELFFQKVEKVLQSRDPIYTELATVYLMALGLGFCGKFRGLEGATQLDHYRRRLFAFICQRNPDLRHEAKHLFPQAYAYILDQGEDTRLPDPRKWMAALAVLILILGVVSHALWMYLTADLVRVIQQILTPT